MFKFYEVGGCVRDEILGLKSKDIDYVAVAGEDLLKDVDSPHTLFGILEEFLRLEKFEIFLVTADCFTIRGKFPVDHRYQGIADFVMARKETGYIPFTRTPIVVPGTLYDDLERRDFTLNALAKDEDGNIILEAVGQVELCVLQEFILRFFNTIKRDGKKWFFTPEMAIWHKLYTVFV